MYISNSIQGVNLKEFGAFTMEVISDYVKPLQHSGFNLT